MFWKCVSERLLMRNPICTGRTRKVAKFWIRNCILLNGKTVTSKLEFLKWIINNHFTKCYFKVIAFNCQRRVIFYNTMQLGNYIEMYVCLYFVHFISPAYLCVILFYHELFVLFLDFKLKQTCNQVWSFFFRKLEIPINKIYRIGIGLNEKEEM